MEIIFVIIGLISSISFSSYMYYDLKKEGLEENSISSFFIVGISALAGFLMFPLLIFCLIFYGIAKFVNYMIEKIITRNDATVHRG